MKWLFSVIKSKEQKINKRILLSDFYKIKFIDKQFVCALKKQKKKNMATTSVICNQIWNDTSKPQLRTTSPTLSTSSSSISSASTTDDVDKMFDFETIARNELREDDSIREQSLAQFRNWIEKNEDIRNIRIDDIFLLRFLRVKKFSVPMAEQLLLKYLNLKKIYPEMAYNLDFLSESMNELITSGYIVPSPIRDQYGRRVVIASAANFNPYKYTCSHMVKLYVITFECLLEDSENQIMGFTHVGDVTGATAQHIKIWNPMDFIRIIRWGEQSFPMRHRAVHIVNAPTALRYVVDGTKTLLSNKMKDRLHTHGSLSDLHKQVDPMCLPAELGGKIPMKDMIEMWKMELQQKHDILLKLDKMEILNDRGIIRRHNKSNDQMLSNDGTSIVGSFRKLELD